VNNAIVIPSAFSTLEAREKALQHARSLDMGECVEMCLAYDRDGEPCDPDATSWCFDVVIWPAGADLGDHVRRFDFVNQPENQ
jgi:hypothetical protein